MTRPASAAATQLESRGHAYWYPWPECQPASTAPSGWTASLRSSNALVAMARCVAVAPGTRPARSQSRSARSAAATQADSARVGGAARPGAA